MREVIDLTLVLCMALGFILGILSGLVPGLHINNFAAIMLALSPQLMAQGLTSYHMASIVLAASISQTFFDCIPAIFVGAPDADTALTVLPGHRLMLEGRGIEAVRLSALGS
ncbi:MAG TPA: tripartite tricarboxylate transporter permease, partial [Methanotrichaceae archaeon]|nr:tripartite tricarboxylate transporter permease [Methanotrichaceae archaeon]